MTRVLNQPQKKLFFSILGLFFCLWGIWIGISFLLPILTGQTTSVTVRTFLDTDRDGILDGDDKPLPDVCVWTSRTVFSYTAPEGYCQHQSSLTKSDDTNNLWSDWKTSITGSSCESVYIFANSPNGYFPTTSLGSQGCYPDFGFTNSSEPLGKSQILLPEQYAYQTLVFEVLDNIFFLLLMVIVAWLISEVQMPKQNA